MSFAERLKDLPVLWIQQRRELAELLGAETRNKYAIETEQGELVAFAAEQQKGVLGFLLRQFLGHWRTFEILIFEEDHRVAMRAVHPFRFWFQRLEITLGDGTPLGAIQQRFSIFTKRFDVLDGMGQVLMTVSSPIWNLWAFPFMKLGREVAAINKRWAGLLREAFTDTDKFRIEFKDPELTTEERMLLVASGVFIDLQYFERKARS